MAFENIGIGGVLSFESRGAVANMATADRAFKGLESKANQLSTAVGRISSGFSRLNVGGSLLALAGGISFAGLIREGVNFNKEMETSKLAIATVMAATTKTPLEENIINAGVALDRLNVTAAQTPGEIGDLVNIYQLLAGPITSAKGGMEDILTISKGTAIMAGVLKRSFQDTGATIAKMQAGSAEAGNDIIIMLRSMGLLTEETSEWKAMLPEQRLKRIHEIMSTFAESGEKVGQTFDAQASTVKSLGKIIMGAFTERLFARMTETLGKVAKGFYDNEKAVMAAARAWGDKFGAAVEFVGEAVIQTAQFMHSMFTLGRDAITRVTDAVYELGYVLDTQLIGKLVFIGTTFAAITMVLSPLLSTIGMLGGKLMAIGSILRGLAGIAMVGVGPLLTIAAIVAGIFLLFRRDGETVGETLGRAFEYAREVAMRFVAVTQPLIGYLIQAFDMLVATGMAFWQGIQPGLEQLRIALHTIVNIIIGIVEAVIPMIGEIIVGATSMIEAIRPGLEAVFNVLARLIRVVVDALALIIPKVMAILGPIISVLVKIAVKIAEVFGKLLEFIAPVLNAIVTVLEEVVVPVLGWILDVFGPVLAAAFEAVGFVVGLLLDVLGALIDALTFIVEVALVPFKLAWEGIKWLFDQISGAIDFMLQPLYLVIGVIGDLIGLLGDALDAVGGFLNGVSDFVTGVADAVAGGIADAAGAVWDFIDSSDEWKAEIERLAPSITSQFGAVEAAINSANAAAMEAAQLAEQITAEIMGWNAAISQTIAMGKIQQIVDEANIEAKMHPDVNVNVKNDIKSNLCIDGKAVSAASARHQIETQERAGFNNTPWQNRRVQISGTGGNK